MLLIDQCIPSIGRPVIVSTLEDQRRFSNARRSQETVPEPSFPIDRRSWGRSYGQDARWPSLGVSMPVREGRGRGSVLVAIIMLHRLLHWDAIASWFFGAFWILSRPFRLVRASLPVWIRPFLHLIGGFCYLGFECRSRNIFCEMWCSGSGWTWIG